MEENRHEHGSLLVPLVALVILFAGLLLMGRFFGQSQEILVESQDGQHLKTAQSVDNNILGHFNWYCSDLAYITSRERFLTAEQHWSDSGDTEELLYLLRENPLPKTDLVETMLALRDGKAVLSTDGSVDYTLLTELGQIGTSHIFLCKDGQEALCVAIVQAGSEADYAAVIAGETFFSIAEHQSAVELRDRIFLLDNSGQYFFHRTTEGVRIDRVTDGDGEHHPSLQLLLGARQTQETTTSFYQSKENYQARLVILPAPGNANGCFTVGLSHNFDESFRPVRMVAVQMAMSGALVAAGAVLLLVFLLRSRRAHRQTQMELALLREKAKTMEQLNLQTQELTHHQRLETIGTLTAGIAHEFNNLLTPIMGYSILVLEKLPPEDTESYDSMLEIYNASRKAKGIISRLSSLSRKNPVSSFQPLRLDEMIERTLAMAAPIQPKKVEVKTRLACGDALFSGSEVHITQMLLNLFINAFQAMETEGGILTVSTGVEGGEVWVRVEDTGPGIPPQARERIFEPFFTTKDQGKGTGLGLAIVGQVTEDHGGTVEVQSASGGGACFTIRLPALSGQRGATPPTENVQ